MNPKRFCASTLSSWISRKEDTLMLDQYVLYEWADDGGPGGQKMLYLVRPGPDGRMEFRAQSEPDTPFEPWPTHYIQLSEATWAKHWRYCVHAPGDPLFSESDHPVTGK
jgi:hypothetical protein